MDVTCVDVTGDTVAAPEKINRHSITDSCIPPLALSNKNWTDVQTHESYMDKNPHMDESFICG